MQVVVGPVVGVRLHLLEDPADGLGHPALAAVVVRGLAAIPVDLADAAPVLVLAGAEDLPDRLGEDLPLLLGDPVLPGRVRMDDLDPHQNSLPSRSGTGA